MNITTCQGWQQSLLGIGRCVGPRFAKDMGIKLINMFYTDSYAELFLFLAHECLVVHNGDSKSRISYKLS